MATDERFTDLPTTTAAQMSDIICTVQGYSSPSSLGLSVQETLGQVYQLFQSNVVLYHSGNPNGLVAGTTYQLLWDTTNFILYVCTTSGNAATAIWQKSITLTAGTGISLSQSGTNIQISASGEGFSFVSVTSGSANMVSDTIYQANFGSLVTLTLPVTSSLGDFISVSGFGSGGWKIAQNSGQNIIVGDATTTTTTGYLASTNQYDGIQLYCAVANTTWQNISGAQGNITIV